MAKDRRDCLTCKWEPDWQRLSCAWQRPDGSVEETTSVRGQCRFPNGHNAVRSAKLPQGAHISTPWMGRDKVKHNCPAWAAKDGETE